MRYSLHALLEVDGHSVHAYASAQAFLDVVAEDSAGCVMTDLEMPIASGVDLMMALNDRHVSMPVIVMTGSHNAKLVDAAKKQWPFAFFRKPFDPDALLAAVAKALLHIPTPSRFSLSGGQSHISPIL